MAKNDSKKVTYTKDMLIKTVAKDCRIDRNTVKDVYESLEDIVSDALSSANEDSDVSVRLFEGIVLNGVYVPSHEKVNNLTGKTIITKSKIVPKVHITRTYCDKISSRK
jgi:L-rhamnose isomerase